MSPTMFHCCECMATLLSATYDHKEAQSAARRTGWRRVLDYHFRRYVWCCPSCLSKRKEAKAK